MKDRTSQNNNATSNASGRRPRAERDLRSVCLFEALEGRALLSASILATPTVLTATASAPTTVQLHWKDSDTTATGYFVLRSTDGVHYTQISKLTSGAVSSFTDVTALSGRAYDYEIQAQKGTTNSAVSTRAIVTTPLAAVSKLTASATGPKTVQLNWTDNDASATGYYILRATDGVHFTQISKVTSATVKTFTDATAVSGHAYQYGVEAFDAAIAAPASNAASIITPLAAPTGLAASLSGLTIKLTWTDTDSSATGYNVFRSTDNVHFCQITTLSTGSANTYTDSSTTYGTTYYYKIQAFDVVTTSTTSAVVSKATPTPGVSIATEFGDELVITAAGADDSIAVSESGYTFTITADGNTFTDAATSAGLFIYTRGGTDTINIAKSVTSDTTVETIDGAATSIASAGTDVTSWIDSTDIYTGTGAVHRISTFAGGVSKAIGAALANPKDAGATIKVSASLFGAAPIAGDANQGEVGDCYFLSSLAAFAGQDPSVLVQSAVDMGDGTYVVQFMSHNTPTFVRVSNAFSSGPFGGFMYAHPGTDGSIWAMVMEKAFADFRTGANTYASINSGWMGEVYSDFGISSMSFSTNSYTQTTLFNMLSADLASGDAVTFGTSQSPPNLVGDHAYTLVSAYKDSSGVAHYVVRNPWGVAGDAVENSQGYATLTFAQMVANFVDGCA
jgi:fibronectin type 3 domain-containing protein